MACTAHGQYMYDTVSDTQFGPQCEDESEALRLAGHIKRTRGLDPRQWEAWPEHEKALAELRDGTAESMPTHPSMLCFCGGGKMRRMSMYSRGKQFSTCDDCNDGTFNNWTEGPPR